VTLRIKRQSGADWESRFGYSRVVRHGALAWVAGTTAASEGDATPTGAADQTRKALEIAVRALESVGMSRTDVVRTRMYLTRVEDAEAVGGVHAEIFGDVGPAATMVVIAELVDPELLVEVELDASSESSSPDLR
jgi:enamine deaminase RidA (YjgF/YER057c/UK114 family)